MMLRGERSRQPLGNIFARKPLSSGIESSLKNAKICCPELSSAIFQRCFRSGMDVEFVVNVLQMPADRFHADTEAIGNLLIGKAMHHLIEHFPFADGQLLHPEGG